MTEGAALEVGRRNKIAVSEAKKLLYALCIWLRHMVSLRSCQLAPLVMLLN